MISRAIEVHTSIEDSQSRKYEILRTVNRGGMGEIAMGRVIGTKGFEKLVVLKRLRADAEREDHVAMFDVEQEVMSRVEHPNVVKVFDQPTIEEVPYLAMEYVRGRNLDQMIRAALQQGHTITSQIALTIVAEVLRGLAFVHRLKDNQGKALGVVHQDMTPSNVMLSFFGEVKITDFGISYVTSRDGGLRKGVLKGKPRYVAPEVLAGKRVNNRADIYGVGAILYELLKGQALFARSSVKETLSAVARNELPDFAKEFPKESPGLVQLFERSLAKDPAERYRTAEEMAADVLIELSKAGGPVTAASLGLFLRRLFENDPDIPEMDPALEAAIQAGEVRPEQAELKPRDLDETLMELDRLLGPGASGSSSIEQFELPEELRVELSELSDMDPFRALTPLPDFVWDAENEQEILQRAEQAYPEAAPLTAEADREPRTSRPAPEGTSYSMVKPGHADAPVRPERDPPRTPPPPRAPRPTPSDAAEPTFEPDAPPTGRSFGFGLVLGLGVGAALGAAAVYAAML